MLCVAFPICRAVSTRPLFLNGELRLARTIPLIKIFLQRKSESADIDKQNWNKKPSPGGHVSDLGLDIIALVLVSHREVNHGFEPGLGRPFVGWVGLIGLGDAFQDALASGLIGDEEDKDYCGESEEDGEKLEN